jgi:hypothetical protein
MFAKGSTVTVRGRIVLVFVLLCTTIFLLVSTILLKVNASGSNMVYMPYLRAGSGLCSDAFHNSTEWHSLMDPLTGCHYDHEHKHSPNDVADIFGPAGAWFGGSSLSYPWQTNNENQTKHEAYAWIVRHDIPANGRDVWIKDFRWQVHAISAPFTAPDGTLHGGYLGRFHSYSLEAQVCNSSGQCGIVRTGGWIDFGNLEIDGIDDCVDLPSDPSQQETCSNLGRRRIHYYWPGSNMPNKSTFFWYGRAGLLNGEIPALHPVQVAVATNDGSVNLVPDDLYSLHFFCPDWECPLNNSTIQAHVVGFGVDSKFDPDKNGIANFNGYTDRYGVLVDSCTTPSLDCVPLIIEHAPVGLVQHRDDKDLGISTAGEQDFDISPEGLWWIEYPETLTFDTALSPQEISQIYVCSVPTTMSPALARPNSPTAVNSVSADNRFQSLGSKSVSQLVRVHPNISKQ